MANSPEYITVDWTRKVLDNAAAWLVPAISEKYKQEATEEQAKNFSEIVVPELDSNIWANLSTYLTPAINGVIDDFVKARLSEAATVKGERMVVVAHDEKGRIKETVKIPIWATVQITPSQLPQGTK